MATSGLEVGRSYLAKYLGRHGTSGKKIYAPFGHCPGEFRDVGRYLGRHPVSGKKIYAVSDQRCDDDGNLRTGYVYLGRYLGRHPTSGKKIYAVGCMNCEETPANICDPGTFRLKSQGGVLPDTICCHIDFDDANCGHPDSVDVDLIYEDGLGDWLGHYTFEGESGINCFGGGEISYVLAFNCQCCPNGEGEFFTRWFLIYSQGAWDCGLQNQDYSESCPLWFGDGSDEFITPADIYLEPFLIIGSDTATPTLPGYWLGFKTAHFTLSEGPC